MFYKHKRKNGMNSRPYYFATAILRYLGPSFHLRRKLKRTLAKLNSRPDKEYILNRVEYYNKLKPHTPLGDNATEIGALSIKRDKSYYVLDTQEFSRWFNPYLKWNYRFGDVTTIPEVPAILKSRPIAKDNSNSILLNLDKVRHFTFMKDKKAFRDKKDMFIFRGHISHKPHRIRFMEMYFEHPMCEAGIINPMPDFPKEWTKEPITIWEHLDYKFVITLEGNDVASNLKWVLSSNSIAVMPQPKYETWFMEGTLIPNYHYIEIKPDYSDLVERLEYYMAHPEEAEAISRNAHEYIKQFLNPEREKLISLLVLDKYFRMTDQA